VEQDDGCDQDRVLQWPARAPRTGAPEPQRRLQAEARRDIEHEGGEDHCGVDEREVRRVHERGRAREQPDEPELCDASPRESSADGAGDRDPLRRWCRRDEADHDRRAAKGQRERPEGHDREQYGEAPEVGRSQHARHQRGQHHQRHHLDHLGGQASGHRETEAARCAIGRQSGATVRKYA
jgi:hypothetical protein